jgi:hypothetical protein
MALEEPELELSEEPEVARGHEDASEQEEAGEQEQEAGPNSAAYSRGRWEGSDVSQDEIDWLYRSRRIPEGVTCRIPVMRGNQRLNRAK